VNDRRSVTVMGWYKGDATGERFVCLGADQKEVKLYSERRGTEKRVVSRDDFAMEFSAIEATEAERAWAWDLLEKLWAGPKPKERKAGGSR